MDRRKAITVVAILRTLWGISFAQAESDCAKLAQGALSAGPIVLMYHDIVPDGTLPGLEKADRCKVLSMISEPTPLQAVELQPCGATDDVSASQFRQQMTYLRDQGYTFITPEELRLGRLGLARLAPKSVLVTFDDGYDGSFIRGAKILSELSQPEAAGKVKAELKATFFVHTDYVNIAKGETPKEGDPNDHEADRNHVTWRQVGDAAYKSNGLFTIGSHTLDHPKLDQYSKKPLDLDREFQNSRLTIEGGLRKYREENKIVPDKPYPASSIAYPYGRISPSGKFSCEVLEHASEFYSMGFTVGNSTNTPSQVLRGGYAIPRVSMGWVYQRDPASTHSPESFCGSLLAYHESYKATVPPLPPAFPPVGEQTITSQNARSSSGCPRATDTPAIYVPLNPVLADEAISVGGAVESPLMAPKISGDRTKSEPASPVSVSMPKEPAKASAADQ